MDFIPQFTAVAAVLGLLGMTLWWLRRRGFAAMLPLKRSTSKKLECLERLSLSPQHTLHLVRLGSATLLVSSSPSGCVLIERVTSRELEAGQ